MSTSSPASEREVGKTPLPHLIGESYLGLELARQLDRDLRAFNTDTAGLSGINFLSNCAYCSQQLVENLVKSQLNIYFIGADARYFTPCLYPQAFHLTNHLSAAEQPLRQFEYCREVTVFR